MKVQTDNVGKGTLITNIKNHFSNFTLHQLHYSNVKHNTKERTIQYSTKLYREMFQLMVEVSKNNKTGVICDRSHLGEMAYGPLYRGYSGEYVLDIEKEYHNYLPIWDNLSLITLIDKPENVLARDDGLSFSINLDKKTQEIDLFIKAHKQSTIKNKLLLDISTHDEAQAIDAVVTFINSTKG